VRPKASGAGLVCRTECQPFFDLIHSFSARGQNIEFWLLSKNNTGSLPVCGNPAGNEGQTDRWTYKITKTTCAFFMLCILMPDNKVIHCKQLSSVF